ncbi:hypothetical protein [Methylophaga sp.]|jgi:hypothetical protein|nr:hypothetical protein [Methylophaga sp.]MDO8828132.1 hypothetical protein [Methylophaga sp.]
MLIWKKVLLIGASILLIALLSLMIHNAWAGKSVISLNSPVSFPVDI